MMPKAYGKAGVPSRKNKTPTENAFIRKQKQDPFISKVTESEKSLGAAVSRSELKFGFFKNVLSGLNQYFLSSGWF